MTYALLIYRTSARSAPISVEQERLALEGHRALQVDASARAELHAVARLDDTVTAHTVRRRFGAHEVSDGPFIETKEWLVGFYVVDCENDEQAFARARQICPDDSHAIEVRRVTWRWKG